MAPRACHVVVRAATENEREQAIQALQDLGLDPVELFSSAQTISYRVSSDRPAHVRHLLKQVTFDWDVITPDIPDYLFYALYIQGLRGQRSPATDSALPRVGHQFGGARSDGHAFISYVSEDGPVVDQIQQALEDASVPVWRDSAALSPGDDRRDVIRRAITGDTRVFLACFSRHSLANERSDHNEQLALAIDQMHIRDRSKPWLIPVRLDDCTIPDHDIGWGRTLASIQCADLSGDHFEQGLKSLTASVLRILAQ